MSMTRLSNYVVVNWTDEPDDIGPLVLALSFAIQPNRPIDFFLRGIFTGQGPTGGDPGWAIERKAADGGRRAFWAYMSSNISGEGIEEAFYDEATVKRHVRRTLDYFAAVHPDRKEEVDRAIVEYRL